MTDCVAPGCAYPTPEAQFICMNCERALRHDLDLVPDLLADLDVTITRQDRIGSQGVARRGAEQPVPFKDHASEARWVLINTVTTWARAVAEQADVVLAATSTAEAAAWLRRHAVSMAMHPSAGEAVDEIADAVANAYRAIDTPRDSRIYLGMCGDVAGRTGCQGKVYAAPRADVGQCNACGADHAVRQRRPLMLRHMSNHKLTASEISTNLAHLGISVTVQDIQNRARLGDLTAAEINGHRKRTYLVGDVLRLFLGPESMTEPRSA